MTLDQTSGNTDKFPERVVGSRKWYNAGGLSGASPGPLSVQLLPIGLRIVFRLRSSILAWDTSEVCCAGPYFLLTSALPWWLEFPAWPQTCLVTIDLLGDGWVFIWPQSLLPSVPPYWDFVAVDELLPWQPHIHPQLLGPLPSWSIPCLLLLTHSSKELES